MGIKEDLSNYLNINNDSDYSIQLSSFALLNLWLMVIIIVLMIGVFYCCHCLYRNDKFHQRIADLESMKYDQSESQNEDETNTSMISENMELKLQNDVLQRQLTQSLEQIKEFKGLDFEYSSVINDLEKQLNTMNDNLFHKDRIITELLHKMKIMHDDSTNTNTNTSMPNSRMHGISNKPQYQSASGTENGLNRSIELSPISDDRRIKHNIDTTATTTTNIRTSLEVHMDKDMDVDNLDITVTPLSNNSEWKSYMADSKEEEEEEEEKEINENDVTISMEEESNNDQVAIVASKKYKIRKDRAAEMSYITQTPSRTMSAKSVNIWEENSLEKAPSQAINESMSDLQSQSQSHSYSSTQRQLEIQLRSYVMKENEWFYEKKNMEKEISALNTELKAVQMELQGFKAYEYSDKQHELILGIITNYAKR